MSLKEGRFALGTFRSERMQVLNRSCQNDRPRVMLVLVHIDITPPHTPLPVFRRIGERTIPYSWRALSTDDVVSRVLIESSALEQVIAIHLGMATERAGLVSSIGLASEGILPRGHVRWFGERGQQHLLSPGASE
ncbi:uncharacterized protein TNCV_1522901 [Trichonephila clavipes]|nr:uncharacterized protein TNCV_1522901 [Trichonephila clavipes]